MGWQGSFVRCAGGVTPKRQEGEKTGKTLLSQKRKATIGSERRQWQARKATMGLGKKSFAFSVTQSEFLRFLGCRGK